MSFKGELKSSDLDINNYWSQRIRDEGAGEGGSDLMCHQYRIFTVFHPHPQGKEIKGKTMVCPHPWEPWNWRRFLLCSWSRPSSAGWYKGRSCRRRYRRLPNSLWASRFRRERGPRPSYDTRDLVSLCWYKLNIPTHPFPNKPRQISYNNQPMALKTTMKYIEWREAYSRHSLEDFEDHLFVVLETQAHSGRQLTNQPLPTSRGVGGFHQPEVCVFGERALRTEVGWKGKKRLRGFFLKFS